MPPNDKHLLVLSILQGRHFPKIPSSHIIIEARFDGELMTTDPVEHNADPVFSTELAWEVDKKGLHVLRISRTPIKVQCFAVDKKTNSKSAVGYVILDLRLAQFESMKAKWYPVLNSKYSLRPELLLSIGLEEDSNSNNALNNRISLKNNEIHKKLAEMGQLRGDLRELQPRLIEEGGYYQIGSSNDCNENFTFSVTIGFAANLEQLVLSTVQLPSAHRGFFFYYSLLGNDILTDPFQNLVLAEFSAERATVKLRSNIASLRAFFKNNSTLTVHLCCDELSLGCAEVPLDSMLPEGITDITQPVTVENAYELKTSRHSQMTELPHVLKPVIGVVITLKGDQEHDIHKVEPMVLNSSPEPTSLSLAERVPSSNTKRRLQYPQTPPQKLDKQSEFRPNSVPSENAESGSNSSDDGQSVLDHPQESSKKITEFVASQKPNVLLHKYDLTIDLRMIKNHHVPPPFKCFLRYSYPYFGDIAPILTRPAVEVPLGSLAYFQHGSTIFSFATPPNQLQKSFKKCPIRVEVLHHNDQTSEDNVIGHAVIDLRNVIVQGKTWTVNNSGKTAWKQHSSELIPVLSAGSNQRVADLQVYLVLEDFGEFDNGPPTEQIKAPQSVPSTLDDKMAEQVAYELEQWKAWQEDLFLNQLKQKEAKHLEALVMEWTKRETERELLMKKKLVEYQELEEKLKSALSSIEKRETYIEMREAELERMRIDLQAEYNRHIQDVKDATRRMKEDCEHRIEIERSKGKALQDHCNKLERDLNDTEKKLEYKTAEFQAFKDQKQQPDLKLQSDLKLMALEKGELERRINTLTKSKVHYKQQYGRCLKELARLKQAMQAEAQEQLRKQQQELEQMKMQLIASEQQQSIKGHQHILHELKNDIQSIQKNIGSTAKMESQTVTSGPISSISNEKPYNDVENSLAARIEESCLAHLVEEKETLLKTGLYSPDDPIIVQLEKQITDVIMRMKR